MSHYVGLLIGDSTNRDYIDSQLEWYWEQPEYCPRKALVWEPYDEEYQEDLEEDHAEFDVKHDGVWGYLHNPEAMFDWYEVGGRWAGLLHGKSIRKKSEVNLDELRLIPYFIMSPYFTDQHVFAQGRMGWFGVSDDNFEDTEWEVMFRHLWDQLDDDLYVVVLDFHI